MAGSRRIRIQSLLLPLKDQYVVYITTNVVNIVLFVTEKQKYNRTHPGAGDRFSAVHQVFIVVSSGSIPDLVSRSRFARASRTLLPEWRVHSRSRLSSR